LWNSQAPSWLLSSCLQSAFVFVAASPRFTYRLKLVAGLPEGNARSSPFIVTRRSFTPAGTVNLRSFPIVGARSTEVVRYSAPLAPTRGSDDAHEAPPRSVPAWLLIQLAKAWTSTS